MCSVCTAVVIKKLYSMHTSVDIFYVRNNSYIYILILILMYMQVTSMISTLECIMPNKPSDYSLTLS